MNMTTETIKLHPVGEDKPHVPFAPAFGGPKTLSPEEAKDSKREKTVAMMFPRRVHLTVQHGTVIEFLPGVQRVPHHLVNHPWLMKNGVTLYKAPVASASYLKTATANTAPTEKDIEQHKRDEAFAEMAKGMKNSPPPPQPPVPAQVVVKIPGQPSPVHAKPPAKAAKAGGKQNAAGKGK